MDLIERLARDDKWQLGCGDGVLFAPSHPRWLDTPGFWDPATFFQHAIEPLFTVTLLDADGRRLALRATARRWTPAELTVEYHAPLGVTATEVRSVQPGGIFASEWRLRTLRPIELHLVAWTVQEASALGGSDPAWSGALTLERSVPGGRDAPPLRVSLALTCTGGATSWSAIAATSGPVLPEWGASPFPEQWRRGGLPGALGAPVAGSGVYYAAVHRDVRIEGTEGGATFAMRVTPVDTALRLAPAGAGPRGSPTSGAGIAATLGGASRRRWGEWFARVPRLHCSEPYLDGYWRYRWYGLQVAAVAAGVGQYRHPMVCRGLGAAHHPVADDAPAHVRELRWAHDPERARGVLRGFLAHQRHDGSLPARLTLLEDGDGDHRHADWGGALVALDEHHPDDAFAGETYFRLSRYADWLLRTHDEEGSGLVSVLAPAEAGQGVAPRFHAVDPGDDSPVRHLHLKAVDATVHAYTLVRALEHVAARGGNAAESARWHGVAERIRDAVRDRMWDADAGLFLDVDPLDGRRVVTQAVGGFLPFGTDLADDEQRAAMLRALLDPSRFATTFPIPSCAMDDPLFSAEGLWMGRRVDEPWNGRVWPEATCRVIDALGSRAQPGDARLRELTARLLRRLVHMLFEDGNLGRPTSHEHYNPLTGASSAWRGEDDQQRLWVNDLIVRYVAGVRPHAAGVTVDPFPFGIDLVELDALPVRGAMMRVAIDGARYTVEWRGERHERALGETLQLR